MGRKRTCHYFAGSCSSAVLHNISQCRLFLSAAHGASSKLVKVSKYFGCGLAYFVSQMHCIVWSLGPAYFQCWYST